MGFHAVRERNPRSSVRHAPRNYLWPKLLQQSELLDLFHTVLRERLKIPPLTARMHSVANTVWGGHYRGNA
jgi:hypothetical protein